MNAQLLFLSQIVVATLGENWATFYKHMVAAPASFLFIFGLFTET